MVGVEIFILNLVAMFGHNVTVMICVSTRFTVSSSTLMNPFLSSTIAFESAVVKFRFRRNLGGEGSLNDVGREVSDFLSKSSRELTFNCPCNTVMLPDIWFTFIRRGVLMVVRCFKEELALAPLFSAAAIPQLLIPGGKGSLCSWCYDPVENALYILYWKDDACSLYVIA
ncbi:hypothetical protein FOZ62_027773 [Perkinsus olseni]|uniref:Uncharacterized protein n=1 Tax=Perkinsus olseni TaxID=32597 RepID=A0A7J6QVN0_PEROL|nr:hypothetical protein FOZ62_027773 [Perkinsus olseni]